MKHTMCLVMMLVLLLPNIVWAGGMSLIRDDETEAYLRAVSEPIFRAAGLSPQSIRTRIVNDKAINAFVAGGQNLFIHTGLILESKDAGTLIGVIAHEAGHIAGGHIARKKDEFEQAGWEAAIGTILGIASVAAGAPAAAGVAVASGGTHVAERNFLKHSRQHEEAADQAALGYLETVNISPRGLFALMEKFAGEQRMLLDEENAYRMTHPLSAERLSHMRAWMEANPDKAARPVPHTIQERHERVLAKLGGYLNDPEETLAKLKGKTDFNSRYARAVAYYRQAKLDEALLEVDALIHDHPDDPYLHELLGQMLFEHSYLQDALASYRTAVRLAPDAPMIRYGMGLALISLSEQPDMEAQEQALLKEAVATMERMIAMEPRNSMAWRQLGIAEGRSGHLGQSYLALAEGAFFANNKKEARHFASLAQEHLEKNSRAYLKAGELLAIKEEGEKKNP